jgi:hypothetical protein
VAVNDNSDDLRLDDGVPHVADATPQERCDVHARVDDALTELLDALPQLKRDLATARAERDLARADALTVEAKLPQGWQRLGTYDEVLGARLQSYRAQLHLGARGNACLGCPDCQPTTAPAEGTAPLQGKDQHGPRVEAGQGAHPRTGSAVNDSSTAKELPR